MNVFYGLTLAAPLPHADIANGVPADTSAVDAINCRLDIPGYMQFAMAIVGEEKLCAKASLETDRLAQRVYERI